MVGFPTGKGLLTQLWGPLGNPIHLRSSVCFPAFLHTRSISPWRGQPWTNGSPAGFWFLRRGGDIIVISLEKEAGTQRGHVIAVLKARELTPHG